MTEDPFVTIARALKEHGGVESPRGVSCYVALGDSFTAGTGSPDGLGWADRIARSLQSRNPAFVYRNLAEDGATSVDVLSQLGQAVQLEPDLVTVICGANDVLQSTRPDASAYGRRLTEVFRSLHEAGPRVIVVTATSPERWDFVRMGPRTRARVEGGMRRFNDVTRTVAQAHRVPCLDVADHPGLSERENFATDGLHPSSRGHARAAHAFALLLRDGYRIPIGHLEGEQP
jgi:phosphatidylinositol alpha 1,6-mannosyltransferase